MKRNHMSTLKTLGEDMDLSSQAGLKSNCQSCLRRGSWIIRHASQAAWFGDAPIRRGNLLRLEIQI